MHTDILAMMAATLFAGSMGSPHRPLTVDEAINEAAKIYAHAEKHAHAEAKTVVSEE